MKLPESIRTFQEWPPQAQRFYLGMQQSLMENGQVIVPPGQTAAAEELLSAAEEDRIPRIK